MHRSPNMMVHYWKELGLLRYYQKQIKVFWLEVGKLTQHTRHKWRLTCPVQVRKYRPTSFQEQQYETCGAVNHDNQLILTSYVLFGVLRVFIIMASLEKLIKTIEQLRSIEETTTDANHVKKKEVRLLLSTLVELSCNTTVQSHKEYVSYISSSIDTIIKLYDSKESDVRLASDEGLYRIIKVQ